MISFTDYIAITDVIKLEIMTSTATQPQPINAHITKGCSNKSPKMLTVESTIMNLRILKMKFILLSR